MEVNMATIKEVLDTDAQFRHEGVENDLFKLTEVDGEVSWDYSSPTLCRTNWWGYTQSSYKAWKIPSLEDFRKKLFKVAPILQNIDMDHLFIAGGSVGDIITQRSASLKDIDIFVVGLIDEKAASRRVERFLDDVIKAQKAKHEEKERQRQEIAEKEALKTGRKKFIKHDCPDIDFMRNRNSVAFLAPSNPMIQVIFRLYKTNSEVLHGFDLGSSAVGFDGKDVWFTTLSRFCYERRINVVDTTRRSTTYEYRLRKYLERGFEVVMPHLDITKLKTYYHKYNIAEVCELPYMTFSYSSVNGNRIVLNSFHNRNGDTQGDTSDYGLDQMLGDPYKIFAINMHNLIKVDRPATVVIPPGGTVPLKAPRSAELLLYHTYQGLDTNILSRGPHLSYKMIETYYDSLRGRVLEKGKLNVEALQSDVTVMTIADITKDLFAPGVDRREVLKNIFEKQVDRAKELVKPVLERDHSILSWITKSPGTQLTSSFNPIIEDPEKWYGEYWKSDYEVIPRQGE